MLLGSIITKSLENYDALLSLMATITVDYILSSCKLTCPGSEKGVHRAGHLHLYENGS